MAQKYKFNIEESLISTRPYEKSRDFQKPHETDPLPNISFKVIDFLQPNQFG